MHPLNHLGMEGMGLLRQGVTIRVMSRNPC
jgi:hypothetical protein